MNDILVFIPTYNEKKNIEIICNKLINLNFPLDILIIDDSSPDNTYQFAKEKFDYLKNFTILKRKKKLGIGSAHLDSINHAYNKKYKYLITMDADLTHKPEDIEIFLKEKNKYDLIIGTRFKNNESLKDWNIIRKLITNGGHILTKHFLKIPFDATGAFRLYNLEKISINDFNLIKSKHYDFFFESIMLLNKKKYKIFEVPITLPKRTYGNSKMSYLLLFNSLVKIIILFFKHGR